MQRGFEDLIIQLGTTQSAHVGQLNEENMTRQVIFTGSKIQLALDGTLLPDGSVLQREVVLHPGAAVIVPWLDDDRVCMLRHRRHAINDTLWEFPAGTLNPRETHEEAARRELTEETGYSAGKLRRLAEFYPSPGILNERMVLFLAEDLRTGPMRLDLGEEFEPALVPWAQALAWAKDGTIRDAKTLIGIFLVEHERAIDVRRT